jgi:CBS domain-containing protein
MSSPVSFARTGATLQDVDRMLTRFRISSLPVVDEEGKPEGVITRADLLREGTVMTAPHGRIALALPGDRLALQAMKHEMVTVAPSTSVSEAAKLLVDKRIHRLFVSEDEELVGVFSTKDVMRALVDARVESPISAFMSSPVESLHHTTTLSVATNALKHFRATGLLVVQDQWPVGVFTHVEALLSRNMPGDTPVQDVMGYSLLRLPLDTPVHQAAAEAFATRARRIIAMDGIDAIRGILTGIDLAGAAILS